MEEEEPKEQVQELPKERPKEQPKEEPVIQFIGLSLFSDLHYVPGIAQKLPAVPACRKKLPGLPNSILYSGSRFQGFQKSRGNCYDVEVVLHNVDLASSFLCGFLKIKGLTDEYPVLTTYFDGEIISERYPFLTRKWDADEEMDRKHWMKFSSFQPFNKTFNSDTFSYDVLKENDFVYMRWKEHFLIPDHNIRDINGASFAGFYYICLQKSLGTIEGLYYHRSSELYQSLSLKHISACNYEVYQFR
ncbi:glucose-induced degradation protein 4 homolog [Paramacrobiotus metropolitanus]|uniref:glucose-induced degradation protein 4 homolog n=1 Tax=Paramacrobiotus metropolitanus TaxID=2943436 RepID=UPI0024464BB6|nr:glucose-induced degradation protein 4 homolog [Paramacrobiotus metropolitanus]